MLKSFCLLTIETIRAIEVLGQGDEVLKVNLWGETGFVVEDIRRLPSLKLT